MKKNVKLNLFLIMVLFGFSIAIFTIKASQTKIPCKTGDETSPQSAELGSFELRCATCTYRWIKVDGNGECSNN